MVIRDQYVALTLLIHMEERERQSSYQSRITEALQQAHIDEVHVRIKLITKKEKDAIAKSQLQPIFAPDQDDAEADLFCSIYDADSRNGQLYAKLASIL